VKRRVAALEELQEQHDELHEAMLARPRFRLEASRLYLFPLTSRRRARQVERRALEAKYAALYAPLYTQRSGLVSGAVDVAGGPAGEADAPPGVPDFWLIALRNHEVFAEQISEKDAPVLAHLVDVSSAPLPVEDAEGEEQHGFCLTFTFSPNPHFANATLSKTYFFSDEEETYLVKSEGTPIAWAAGKNTTVKVLKKKGKPGKGGAPAKTLTKLEPCESFFNFFSPPEVPEDAEELGEEEMERLQDFMESDTEMGAILRDEIIPNAVAWFTGAAVEDEGEEEEEEEEEDEGEEEDDEEEEEEEEAPRAKGKKGGKPLSKPAGGAEGQQECKQQ